MARKFTDDELREIGTPVRCEKTDSQVRALEFLLRKGVCPKELGDSFEQGMYDFPEEVVISYLKEPLGKRGSFIDWATKKATEGEIDAYKPYLSDTPTRSEFLDCIDANFRISLSEYQKYGIAYMLAAKHLLLGDECGLGKTVELCGVLARLRDKGILKGFVICVPGDAAEQWQREILRFTGMNAVVLDTSEEKWMKLYNGELYTDAEMANIDGVIIKHSMLKEEKGKVFLGKLHDLLDYNVCALDESSVTKNTKTHCYASVEALVQETEYVYFLNATAFELVIEDLYAQFKLLANDMFRNKTWVEDRFCVIKVTKVYLKYGRTQQKREIKGYKNTEYFRSRIRYFYLARTREELGYVRNNKCSCLLYEKTKDMNHGIRAMGGRWSEVLNCPSLCEWNKAYLPEDMIDYQDSRAFYLPMEPNCLPKLHGLYDLIGERWKAGIRHIVVYVYHVDAQDKIQEDLEQLYGGNGLKAGILSGTTKKKDRQAVVDAFNGGQINVLVTNISTSLNLSVGEMCIFYSVVTNPSRLLQIASRINRDTSAREREYVVLAYRGEEMSNILNAYKRSEHKKKLLGDYADASTDILGVCYDTAKAENS